MMTPARPSPHSSGDEAAFVSETSGVDASLVVETPGVATSNLLVESPGVEAANVVEAPGVEAAPVVETPEERPVPFEKQEACHFSRISIKKRTLCWQHKSFTTPQHYCW